MLKNLTRSSVVLAAGLAGVAIATAAAAVLPGAASDTAVEHTTDVTVSGPNAAAGDHPAGTTLTTTSAEDEGVESANEDAHGSAVSDLATSTDLTGAEKGAAIAELASDGRSTARGESGDHATEGATDGQAKAAEASATGQEHSAGHRP